jgi:hypothetical protein
MMCQQVALDNRHYNDVPTGGANRWRWITDITMMCQQVALDNRHYNDVPTGGAG